MKHPITFWIGIVALAFVTPAFAQSDPALVMYQSDAPFADVTADLEDAIINRGYVVDNHSFVGDMLQRTAADVGAEKKLYLGAEILQFCSAVVSREVMTADINNIAYCPYGLFVFEAVAKPGEVNVGYRALPTGNGRDQVNTLLDEIAREATGTK